MRYSKTLFSLFLAASLGMVNSTPAMAANSNNSPQTFAILGALGSLAFACYEEKAPCVLRNHINTNELTLSIDHGKDVSLTDTRLALGADWDEKVYETATWELVGRWDVNIHRWTSDLDEGTQTGTIIGLSPIFHYQLKNMSYTPFIEMGGGPHILSGIDIEDENKSTQFQFGSIFGLGVKRSGFEVSYRYLHISNANIKMPNPGTDIHSLHLGYHF